MQNIFTHSFLCEKFIFAYRVYFDGAVLCRRNYNFIHTPIHTNFLPVWHCVYYTNMPLQLAVRSTEQVWNMISWRIQQFSPFPAMEHFLDLRICGKFLFILRKYFSYAFSFVYTVTVSIKFTKKYFLFLIKKNKTREKLIKPHEYVKNLCLYIVKIKFKTAFSFNFIRKFVVILHLVFK